MGTGSADRAGRWTPRLLARARAYPPSQLPRDVLAGIVLSGLIVPQGMAYAGIAGVDPQVGLYAAACGLLVYALLGSSRHLVVSPTSSTAALVAATAAPLAAGDPRLHWALASGIAVGTGLVFLFGRLLRLGFVSDFIAKPVLKGFTFGVALTVILKQAPKLFGVEGGHGRFFQKVVDLVTALPSTHLPTFALGAGALVVMWVLKRFAKRVPPALVALVGGIVAVTALHLKDAGVSVIGSVATGLPQPGLPGVRAHHPEELWAAALGIALVAFSELIGAGRTLAARHGYDIDPNRELLAVGAANLASGLFQGIPVGGGLSGSAANEAAGAKSQVSTATTSVIVVLTLLFLMPLFANLPDAVLAAIVIEAVRGLVDVRETARYVRLRNGVVPHVGAILGVLVLGVLPGMLLAIVLTIALLLRGLARPRVPELGRLGATHVFVSVTGHPDAVRTPGLRILRPEGPLMFANAGEVRGRILEAARLEPRPVQVLVNLEATAEIDVTAADMLSDVQAELERSGVELALTRVRGRVQGFLERSGALARIGAARVFRSQNDAVQAFEARRGEA